MIPPLAMLPILFIVLGLEETAKISLIVIGIPAHRPRPGAAHRRAARGDAGQGPDTGRLDLAARPASDAAADTAAAHRFAAAEHGFCLALPDRRRGHCLHRGAGLSHLPGATLPRHGRDPAVRGLDHAARRGHRPRPRGCRGASSLGPRSREARDGARRGPQCVEGATATRSCSRTCAWRWRTTSSSTIVGASGCGKTTFLRMLLGRAAQTRGRS